MNMKEGNRNKERVLSEMLFGTKTSFYDQPRHFAIVFHEFNIGYGEGVFTPKGRFSLKVVQMEGGGHGETTGMRIEKDMLDEPLGVYSLFFEYLLNHGVYSDGSYFLGQMNLDVVLSIARNLPDVRYGEKPLIISNEYCSPDLKVTFRPGKRVSLSLKKNIEIIPGKYSNFAILDGHIYKLTEAVPIEFIEKLYRGTEINLDWERGRPMEVLSPLKRYFNLDLYREITEEQKRKRTPKVKIEYEIRFTEQNNDLFNFDIVFHCNDLNISREELIKAIRNNEYYVTTKSGFVEPLNRKEIRKLFALLKNIGAQKEKDRYSIHKHNIPLLIKSLGKDKMTNSPYVALLGNEMEKKGDIEMAEGLKKILRGYQIEGLKWMTFLRKFGFSGILADDMGTGKTLQVLSLLKSINAKKPSLVVCPKTLIHHWQDEAGKFFPQLKTLVIAGTAEERINSLSQANDYNLVISSYPIIQRDIGHYEDYGFEYIILDESQYIKNPHTRTSRAVKRLKGNHRLCLTGTPIENSPLDLWSMFDFLMPGFLGNISTFKKKCSQRGFYRHLSDKTSPFVLRRTKYDVLKELPLLTEQVSLSGLTKRQLAVYVQVLEKVRGRIFERVEKEGFDRSKIHILAGLTRLRQICNHPGLLNEKLIDVKNISGKFNLFLELINECLQGGHKVLVFSQFTKMLDIMGRYMESMKIPYSRLDGNSKKRDEIIKEFNDDPNRNIFLISMRAGGLGLNLTKADTVILYDPWWNPMVEEQARDRAYRMGQMKNVNVYRLITKGTIEEKIQDLKYKKKEIFNDIIGDSRDIFDKLSWDELKDIL